MCAFLRRLERHRSTSAFISARVAEAICAYSALSTREDVSVLVAAAFCPHPPLLVPAVASGASDELDDLRAACDEAVSRIVKAGPAMILLLGSAALTRAYESGAHGSLDGLGFDAGLAGDPELPLSLTIGRWLLDRAQWGGAVLAHSITEALPPAVCADLGWRLTTGPKRVAILAMGDGSYCRGEKAPGYLDPDAGPYDASIAAALAAGDYEALAALDAEAAQRLNVTARTPLQALGGAAAGGRWTGDLLYDRAPYGVGYMVAHWSRSAHTPEPVREQAPEVVEEPDITPEPPVEALSEGAGVPDAGIEPEEPADGGLSAPAEPAENSDSGEGNYALESKDGVTRELP